MSKKQNARQILIANTKCKEETVKKALSSIFEEVKLRKTEIDTELQTLEDEKHGQNLKGLQNG